MVIIKSCSCLFIFFLEKVYNLIRNSYKLVTKFCLLGLKFDFFLDGCLILQVKEVLEKNCGVLFDPMGKPDTNKDVPKVHPIIKISEDHFRWNNAFTDGKYRVLEKQKRAYKDAEEVKFDDVVGFVFVPFKLKKKFSNLNNIRVF